MVNRIIDDVKITPLKIIEVPNGDVLHAMKASENSYDSFGEAYFSIIEFQAIKAWKRHHKMILNLIVPIGEVRFVLFDNRANHSSNGVFQQVVLSREYYYRLTIPPMIWVGFQGMHLNDSIILNIANIEHQASEVDKKEINEIDYDWEINL